MSASVNSTVESAREQQFRRVIRMCMWFGATMFLLALALRDLQLDRRLDIVARLDRATPYLSTLGPPARVDLHEDRKRVLDPFSVRVVGEPVYVNLRIPRWFRRATVELEYENSSNLPFKFGVRTHPTQWAFEFPESESLPLSHSAEASRDESLPRLEGRGETVQILRVPFELQRSWQVERNVYRFVLSAPGVSPEQPIVIRGLRVVAEREPVCIGRFCV